MRSISIFLLLTSFLSASAQDVLGRMTDFFEFELHNQSGDTTAYATKVVTAPIIAFEPSTSLQFGVGAKILFKFRGSTPETRTSNIPFSIKYTLRNQVLLTSEFTLFTNREDYLIKGKGVFLKFPFSYFGIGNTTKERDVIELNINNLLFEPLLLKRIRGDLFVGGGLRYNYVWNGRFLEGMGESSADRIFLDDLNTLASGLELASTFDSRDNVLNAINGSFVEFTHGFYGRALGGENRFMLTKLDARKYYKIKHRELDVLAFQFFSKFSFGEVPLYELSALGGRDLLRGFQEGRFNDRHAVFAQAEYRWQALKSLGLVAYAGMGDVFGNLREDVRWDTMKYSIGTGLRFKIVRSENLNIRLDYAFGFGPSNDHNLYLGLAESF